MDDSGRGFVGYHTFTGSLENHDAHRQVGNNFPIEIQRLGQSPIHLFEFPHCFLRPFIRAQHEPGDHGGDDATEGNCKGVCLPNADFRKHGLFQYLE